MKRIVSSNEKWMRNINCNRAIKMQINVQVKEKICSSVKIQFQKVIQGNDPFGAAPSWSDFKQNAAKKWIFLRQ